MPDRSKRARCRARIALQNTINSYASKKIYGARHAFPVAKLFCKCDPQMTQIFPRSLWLTAMTRKRGPLALIIIDGWGHSPARDGNAIALAATPFYDELCKKYPQTLLEAHGSRVGLPAGVMGNSEVGHLNIGSGRVIRMDVSLVDHEIKTGEFFKNKVLLGAIEDARDRGKALHLMGLISDGQVHSSLTHLYALLNLAKQW